MRNSKNRHQRRKFDKLSNLYQIVLEHKETKKKQKIKMRFLQYPENIDWIKLVKINGKSIIEEDYNITIIKK